MTSGLQLKYFVLKPAGKDAYAKASRAAMRKYADLIKEENHKLANELRAWADDEAIIAFEAAEDPALDKNQK